MIVLLPVALFLAADPGAAPWIMSPPGTSASRPNVHSVETTDRSIVVRSSGIALRYLGLLQAPPVPQTNVREFVFELPRHPEPAPGVHSRIPIDIAGVFVNGMPIYNQFETLSYNGANLWHYDAVANNDDGTLTAAGHPHSELTHRPVPGLLDQLAANALIGFALDGYPIYGKKMRSSYRLRSMSQRHIWPDGTELTPEQYGPDVSAANPLGTFAEDYEYVPGSGDLDQFNGRLDNGTYAYFLATDESGRLAYPYLIGPRFYGVVPTPDPPVFNIGTRGNLQLTASVRRIKAGAEVRFSFAAAGIRHFEVVHERPIHFLIVSADLADFDHIHPELVAGDRYEVTHTFVHGGAYRLWADFSLPGEAPRVESWDVIVDGPPRQPKPQAAAPLHAELIPQKPLRTGEDIPITLKLSGADDQLEPYLGAWAHVIIVSEDLSTFSHAHPIDGAANPSHTHILGPTPTQVTIVTSFPRPGAYKMWAQFQRSGQVVTLPFILQVELGSHPSATIDVPPDAIRIRITQHGYEPAKLEIPANRPVTLAFTRDASPNCGADVMFPTLGIRRPLPPGQTVLVELPAQPAGELSFSCGMEMFRGMLIVK